MSSVLFSNIHIQLWYNFSADLTTSKLIVDTVDHALLLEALEKRFGIHGTALTWYRS